MEMINRDNAGKIFFAIGVVICLLMFISKASWSILHVDEYWTYSLVNLPLKEEAEKLPMGTHALQPSVTGAPL